MSIGRVDGRGRAVRLWEVDALRGVAIVLMVIYHALWDLTFFDLSDLQVGAGGWLVFARGIGTLFLMLVGVSLALARSRSRRWRHAAVRGLKIFCWGLAITLITRVAIPDEYILFGILHLIGVAVILSPYVLPLGVWAAPVGAVVISIGFLLGGLEVPFVWGVPFGLVPDSVSMVDYYPIFPWIGVVMIGVALGTWLYPQGERRYKAPRPQLLAISGLSTVGRHSLIIYLVHQPVLLGFFFVIRRATQ